MELRHLRVFVAVATELHFGRAAQRLHLTQPSISGHIRQLETELGVRLLTRTARQVALTDAGAAFVEDARRIVGQADVAAMNMRAWQGGISSRLRVGYVREALPVALPHALRRLTSGAGGPRVQVCSAEPLRLIAQVRDGSLDAAIISLPAPITGLRAVTFAQEYAAIAVYARAFDRDETEIPPEIAARDIVFARPRRSNPGFFDAALLAFATAGVPSPLLEVEDTSVEELLLGVASGTGMALLPMSVGERLHTPGVAFRRLALDDPVSCKVALITRDRDQRPELARFQTALTGSVATRAPAHALAAV